ncbi:phage terminase large subunit [Candidatus Pacearchaeota archaeon]|nr:phage terminase large subunit [Candidatus Pacearchaeota archaeon]
MSKIYQPLKKIIKRLNPLVHQYDFTYSPYHNIALVGGYGSGKSEGGVMRALNKKFEYPKNRVGYYMPTFDLLTLEVFPRFEEELDKIKVRHKVNKSRYFIDIKDKGQLLFRSMDRPEKIVSYQHGDCVIDELDTLTKEKAREVFTKILGRNRQMKKNDAPNTTGIVSTPEGFRFIYENWNDTLANKKIKNKDFSYQIIHASTRDNPHVNMSYIKQLISMYTPEQQKAYIDGLFVNLVSGTVYKYFNRSAHNSNESPINHEDYYETLHIGADFNIGGCVNIVLVERAGNFHAVDEVISNDTYEMVTVLKNRFPNHPIIVYPDASGASMKTNATRSDIQILREHFQVIVDNSNPAIKDRVTSVNSAYTNKRLYINSERCPRLTEAQEQQAYNPKTEQPEKFNEHPAVDDYNDSFGYVVCKLMPIHRPKATTTHASQEKAIQY